jgi:hypothetical protein
MYGSEALVVLGVVVRYWDRLRHEIKPTRFYASVVLVARYCFLESPTKVRCFFATAQAYGKTDDPAHVAVPFSPRLNAFMWLHVQDV